MTAAGVRPSTEEAVSTPRQKSVPTPDMESRILSATTAAEVLENADLRQPGIRAIAVARIAEIQEAQQESAYEKAARLGIPTRIVNPDGRVFVLYDFRGDEPLYRTTTNLNAAISSGANSLQAAPYGLDGTGIKIGIWDEGSVRATHQEFGTRVTKKNLSAPLADHSTHVAGTLGASGVDPKAKGMAPKAAIDSYDWGSDYSEMTAAGAATAADTTSIPISNHSYSYGGGVADMGRYEKEARTVDAISVSLPYYLIFWAAGNDQKGLASKGGYESVIFNAVAKNILTIGAVNDAVVGGVRTPLAGVISDFSSWGPCDDGRIKPDLVANGVSLYSAVTANNTAYNTFSGTSMATPSAAGSAALIEQLYSREFPGQRLRASLLKALLIHSADDLGAPGPDYKYGWGLVNVKAAADVLLSHRASLASPRLLEGVITAQTKSRDQLLTWDGVSPIRATLCWTDPAGNAQTTLDNRKPVLVNNLDLKITAPDGTTTWLPYVMPYVGVWTKASMALTAKTGKNNTDNVEQVNISTPRQPGIYKVSVSIDGALSGTSQPFSLVVTGGTVVQANPPPNISLSLPESGLSTIQGVPLSLSVTATDETAKGEPGTVALVEFFNGTTSLGVDVSPPYALDWFPPGNGTFVLGARATDSQGATSSLASSTVYVLNGDGLPVISSFTPTNPKVGGTVEITGENFLGVSAVLFNGVPAASFSTGSSSKLVATVPASASDGPITVVNGIGETTSDAATTISKPPVVISQIYGGSGLAGAVYNADYVELYNRGKLPVNLTGWSLQYATASGSKWTAANLSGSVAPGKYYLVKLYSGFSGTALPPPALAGSTKISPTSGKLALLNTTVKLTSSSPLGVPSLQDFVGYGSANASEGGRAPSTSAARAIFREGGGETDTNDNANDFFTGYPQPHAAF